MLFTSDMHREKEYVEIKEELCNGNFKKQTSPARI